jgi:4-amino-4-deoxy-L-arabinose transferase-like glycosyltransferase
MQNRLASVLILSAAFLLAFVALFLSRAADDNSLFSWAWTFAHIDASRVYFLLAAGLILSLFLSRIAIPDRFQIPLLALLSFAACIPFWQESELIVDASRYFTQAKHLEVYGIGYFLNEWGRAISAWTDLPLVPFFYGLIFKLFGESRIAIQFFTSAVFSLTVVLTFLIGKTLWDRETGFSAGLLLLGIPYLLTQVPLMLVDVPTMFFLTLSIYTFLLALNGGGTGKILFSLVTIVATVLTKYSVWFMLSVLIIAIIVDACVRTGAARRGPLLRGAVVLLMAAAVSGAILLLKLDVVSEQIRLLREYQGPGLERWGESFHSTFLFQVHPLITIAALASIVLALRKRDARYVIVSWLVLLVVLFGIRRIRYTLPIFPMLTLMAGYGLQAVRRDDVRRFILFGTVTTSLVIGIFAYLPLAGNMSAANLKYAGEYLNTLDAGIIEVITLPDLEPVANPAVAVPLLDLYTVKQIRYHYQPGGLPTREQIERSSLRFTWEYRNPSYYAKPTEILDAPVVVISDASEHPLPKAVLHRLKDYRLVKSFTRNEKIFQYTVGVRIYQKSPSGPASSVPE